MSLDPGFVRWLQDRGIDLTPPGPSPTGFAASDMGLGVPSYQPEVAQPVSADQPYQYEPATLPPLTTGSVIGGALARMPDFQGRAYESPLAAAVRGGVSGLASGFGTAREMQRAREEQNVAREDMARKAAADRAWQAASEARRFRMAKDAKEAGKTPPKTLDERANETRTLAQAAAEGRAAGTPEKSPSSRASGSLGPAGTGTREDAMAIARAIAKGDQPPDLKGLYRLGGPVRAALAEIGYDVTKATIDWTATQKWMASANNPQQLRLRQAAQTAYESLDVVDDLSARLSRQIPRTKVRQLNRASLALAMNGAFGAEAQNTATMLNAQITDIVSELGNVYMGGNSPTDHALQLAQRNLSADWSYNQLRSATDLARKNLRIRLNSIAQSGVVSPSNAVDAGTGAGVNIGRRNVGVNQPAPVNAQEAPPDLIWDGTKFVPARR